MHLSLGPPKTPIAVAAAPTTTVEWDQSLSEVIFVFLWYRLFLLRSIVQFFTQNLHELFCLYIS